ncbi:hypothetical protein [Mucisphaera sp.]|uniref:hypothetical protein n=1 Tax=Mucisphaera sp. TaxID=2913024 RepID=UPI003D138FC0
MVLVGLPGSVSAQPEGLDELPAARAYLEEIEAGIERLREQMPAVTEAADLVAEVLVERALSLGVMGSEGLAAELSRSAGSLALVSGEPGRTGEPVLYVFGVRPISDLDKAAFLRGQIEEARGLKGSGVLIGLGSHRRFERHGLLEEARGVVDVLLDSGEDPEAEVGAPTQTVMHTLAAWAFQAELFSACVRRERIPVIRVAEEVDRVRRRSVRYAGQRFVHDRWLDPIPGGVLGEAYLDAAGELLRDIGTASWPSVSAAARRGGRVMADGGSVYVMPGGAQPVWHLGGRLAGDPGVLRPLHHRGRPVRAGRGDMVVAVGTHLPPGDPWWGEAGRYRSAGQGVVWVYARLGLANRRGRADLVIDTWVPFGEAILKIEGHETRLGAGSGLAGEVVAWLLTAQIPAEVEFLSRRRVPDGEDD